MGQVRQMRIEFSEVADNASTGFGTKIVYLLNYGTYFSLSMARYCKYEYTYYFRICCCCRRRRYRYLFKENICLRKLSQGDYSPFQ